MTAIEHSLAGVGWQPTGDKTWTGSTCQTPCFTPIHRSLFRFCGFVFGVTSISLSAFGADPVEYNRSIRPILAEKCFACHGPDANKREADLRLDRADDADGPFMEHGAGLPITPGNLEKSELWRRLTTEDRSESMPPADSKVQPLSEVQLELLKQWILEGANYEAFWAFVPPKHREMPNSRNLAWSLNRIDRFVMARLEKAGQEPQPPADKRTLIRRVTFDLTGLPPTQDQIQAFVEDPSDNAYEQLVERLMATPRYGEHMTKYWLDLVRFADTNGIHHDHYREMTPYRDWVISAFNDNMPFDQFVIDQLAGDLYEHPTLDQQIASGFNRLHLVIDKGTAIPEESFARNVIDQVTSVGTVFMGLTVGCAVCHDHKYDPITQKDFYQLYAFFNNIDAGPETPGKDIHAPFVRIPAPEQTDRLLKLEQEIASASARLEMLKTNQGREGQASAPLSDGAAGSQPPENTEGQAKADQAIVREAEEELKKLNAAKSELERLIPVTLVMKERSDIVPAYVLLRGAYDQPGEPVERGTPSFLPPLKATGQVKTRMDLARWLVAPEQPLTARVAVNRIWQQLFGVGLVKTSEDFGMQGQWPSHPDLLDELALEFVATQWDVKQLVKLIVCSQTYQQSSSTATAAFKADPENRLLARGSRFRLDAEMIRDQILVVSGLLNETMYGKSVKPPQPADLWKSVSMVSSSTYSFKADAGQDIYRRSLYSFWKRAMPPPQMTIFDAPTRESCIARRERTNTPLQALVLMNEEEYFKAAKHFARRMLAEEPASDDRRLSQAYELVTSRPPDREDLSRLVLGLNALRSIYQEDLQSAQALTSDGSERSDGERIEVAAHAMLINTLFNLDVTKTRE